MSKKPKDDSKETLAWKVLSTTQIKDLSDLDTVEKVQEKMAEYMSLTQNSIDLKEASLLDCYTATYWWTREQSFNPEQQSAMFTLVHTLLDNMKEKHMGIIENVKEFKKAMAGIGVETTEASGGLECFDVSQAKAIADYLYTSLFQHYGLYQFMFTHTQAEEIIGTDLEVEVAPAASLPWPPPLEEGVCLQVFQEHIATPPPTPAPQEDEATQDGAAADSPDGTVSADPERESELMSQLPAEQIRSIITAVFDEMLGGLQEDVAAKLREKENNFIARINKIHKVSDK